MKHHVIGERACPRLGAALGVDGILHIRELVKHIEGFDLGYQLALEEGLAERSVEHKVVGIEGCTAIATTAVHHRVDGQRRVDNGQGVAG